MNRLSSFTSVIGLAAGIAGCADTNAAGRAAGGDRGGFPPSRPISGTLAAIAAPAPDELRSMTVRSLLDGSTAQIAIEAEGTGMRIHGPDGCVSTRPRDWFSPSVSYTGCGTSSDWRSATGEVRVLDALYPLAVGSTGRYWRHAVSATGEASTRETGCDVTDAVAIALPERGETPAYVVRCDDGRVERTTWYSPGMGPVAYREEHAEDGVREAWVRVD